MIKEFTSADLYSSSNCDLKRCKYENIKHCVLDKNKYSIMGSGSSIVGAFFSNNGNVVKFESNKEVLNFRKEDGQIDIFSSITLDKLYNYLMTYGYYIKSVPSYPGASIGGCVAANVHGQNHYKEGCFGNHVVKIKIFHPDKGIILLSRNENKEIFFLTIGGYGVTGVILEVTLKVYAVQSDMVEVTNVSFNSILESYEILISEKENYDYFHGWGGISPSGKQKGIMSLGRISDKGFKIDINPKLCDITPFHNVKKINLFGTSIMYWINLIYFLSNKYFYKKTKTLYDFLFPSAKNFFYFSMFGDKGVIEHQVIIPHSNVSSYLGELEGIIHKNSPRISLCHMKLFSGKTHYLNFDGNGFCLALHLYNNNISHITLKEIDAIDIKYNCIVNLVKDSRISAELISKQYLDYKKYIDSVKKYDPKLRFSNLITEKIFNYASRSDNCK